MRSSRSSMRPMTHHHMARVLFVDFSPPQQLLFQVSMDHSDSHLLEPTWSLHIDRTWLDRHGYVAGEDMSFRLHDNDTIPRLPPSFNIDIKLLHRSSLAIFHSIPLISTMSPAAGAPSHSEFPRLEQPDHPSSESSYSTLPSSSIASISDISSSDRAPSDRELVDQSHHKYLAWWREHHTEVEQEGKGPWYCFLPDSPEPVGSGKTRSDALQSVIFERRRQCFVGHIAQDHPGVVGGMFACSTPHHPQPPAASLAFLHSVEVEVAIPRAYVRTPFSDSEKKSGEFDYELIPRTPVSMLVDTACSYTQIPFSVWEMLQLPYSTSKVIWQADGKSVLRESYACVVKVDNRWYDTSCVTGGDVKSPILALLGRDILQLMDMFWLHQGSCELKDV